MCIRDRLNDGIQFEMNEPNFLAEDIGYELNCNNQESIFALSASEQAFPIKINENEKDAECILESQSIQHVPDIDFVTCSQQEKKKAGRKRKFTPEEDELLLNLIKLHGESKWSVIAEQMPGKNRKQIREHYINFLSKRVTEKCFSPSEDMQILQLIESNGRLWNKIAEQMPGRTALAIKNRYYSKLWKKTKRSCGTCVKSKNSLQEQSIFMEEDRNTGGSSSTNERSSLNISERSSVETGPAIRRHTIKGRKAAKTYRVQIEELQKQKEEIQLALNNVTQKIQSMQLTFQG
eukprot:TRINITY_DN3005_c0_g1_i1.p1 TRINITY_DN3005_c0_g1~~TRINITY_DN3005_c0_g1_i1.p1  ORF type:complete len:292 (-),score=62.62 TRINITY_DN3005_c0_g1_i1:138-1013(-)